jgi:hypothetical protein
MARSKEDDQLPPYAKYEVFKKAFDTLDFFQESGNLIGGFVLAFSILEDRTRAGVVTCFGHINEPVDLENLSKIQFSKIIGKLRTCKAIDSDLENRLREAGDLRNKLTHQMMWRLDVFTLDHILKIRELINEVNKAVYHFEKEHKP